MQVSQIETKCRERERERAICRYSSKLMFLKFGKNTRKTEMFQNFQKSYFYITFLDNCFWICWKISTAPTPLFLLLYENPGKVGWREGQFRKLIFLLYDVLPMSWDVAVSGGWVALYEKIRSMMWELVDCSWQWICFFTMFTLCTTFINQKTYSFQLNWIVANIPQEDHNKNQTMFVSVLRHQTIHAT